MWEVRSALFWDVTQRWVVVQYPRFETAYPSHLQGSRSLRLGLNPWRWDRYVVPKPRYRTTTERCVIPQNSAYLVYNVSEAWDYVCDVLCSNSVPWNAQPSVENVQAGCGKWENAEPCTSRASNWWHHQATRLRFKVFNCNYLCPASTRDWQC
jgi:hypothetical protein